MLLQFQKPFHNYWERINPEKYQIRAQWIWDFWYSAQAGSQSSNSLLHFTLTSSDPYQLSVSQITRRYEEIAYASLMVAPPILQILPVSQGYLLPWAQYDPAILKLQGYIH